MTYFLEFHTPRGVYTSKPADQEKADLILEIFEKCKRDDYVASFQIPTAVGTAYLTTEIIRQTVLVIREAE